MVVVLGHRLLEEKVQLQANEGGLILASLVVDIALVRRALQQPLPGLAAQLPMSPRPRTLGQPAPAHYRDGGVLLLLYPRYGELFLALTRRCAHLAAHAGQVSFPGGLREPQDASLAETALRETREELGVATGDFELLGALTPLEIPSSGYRIHPWVAYSPVRPAFRPDGCEVAELIEAPLTHLLEPATVQEETWHSGEIEAQVPFFLVGEHKVWGATAMVLSEFLALLQAAAGA